MQCVPAFLEWNCGIPNLLPIFVVPVISLTAPRLFRLGYYTPSFFYVLNNTLSSTTPSYLRLCNVWSSVELEVKTRTSPLCFQLVNTFLLQNFDNSFDDNCRSMHGFVSKLSKVRGTYLRLLNLSTLKLGYHKACLLTFFEMHFKPHLPRNSARNFINSLTYLHDNRLVIISEPS